MSVAQLSAMPVRDAVTCCGRGCNGCVWEGFVTAANYWREDAVALLNGNP